MIVVLNYTCVLGSKTFSYFPCKCSINFSLTIVVLGGTVTYILEVCGTVSSAQSVSSQSRQVSTFTSRFFSQSFESRIAIFEYKMVELISFPTVFHRESVLCAILVDSPISLVFKAFAFA